MSELITRASAQEILNAQTFDWGEEEVALTQVQGKVLAEPIVADRDQPPFDRVAMDGIAIHHPAYAFGQRFFGREYVLAAGEQPTPLFGINCCIEIMTGAALPDGCTTVVRYEDLEAEENGFSLPEGIENGKNIHARGKDARAGDVLAEAGSKVGVAAIGMLANFGYARVSVKRLPRIAIIATGNELVGVDQNPEPHEIRMSNVYQLGALLDKAGYRASRNHLPDDRAVLTQRLSALARENDVLILSGGVSKGRFDFVPGVLQEIGVAKLFHGVAQKPGKPIWVGRNDDTMVFGLPGNPQSSLSCCLAYVLPFLDRQLGAPTPATYAKLAVEVAFAPDLTLFSYVATHTDPTSGTLMASPVKHAGSGDASSLLKGSGFLELPAGQDLYPAGGVYRLRQL